MKCTVEKARIVGALKKCSSLVAKKSYLPCLEQIKVAVVDGQLSISATDLNTYLCVGPQSANDNAMFVDLKDLKSAVGLLGKGDVGLVGSGGKLTVKSGVRSSSVDGKDDPKNYPVTPPVGDIMSRFVIGSESLKAIVSRVIAVASPNETRPHINAVCLEITANGTKAIATDGHRLHVCDGPPALNTRFPAEIHTITEIVPLSAMSLVLDSLDGQSDVVFEIGSVFAAVVIGETSIKYKRVAAAYFPWRQIVPHTFATDIVVDRAALIDEMKVVAKADNGCVMTVKKSRMLLEVYARVSVAAGFSTSVRSKLFGKEARVGFSSAYMLDALKSTAARKVSIAFNAELDPIKITSAYSDDSFVAVVMPMRL